jgi:hypothetical protein
VGQASACLFSTAGHSAKVKTRQAEEPVWQPRFPQLVFSVETRKLFRFNKSENAKGKWKSIFAGFHTGSEACAISR